MLTELEFTTQRFAVFGSQVLEPAVYTRCTPLRVAAYQCPEAIAYAAATAQKYEPVDVGWRWGPVWSTCWFRLSGRVPAEMSGQRVALRFSSGTEATLWRGGVPHAGLDPNHEAVELFERAAGNEEVELFVEAACNLPLGVTLFWWEPQALRERWNSATPGWLGRCELAVYDPAVWRLWRAYEFARQLMGLYATDAPRMRSLCEALRRVTVRLDPGNVHVKAEETSAELMETLRGAPASGTRCLAVGQGHMDTAWLWRVRETKRKCVRTFATALRLMEQYPEYQFLWSQAQQYAWVQEGAPELFAQVQQRVREGRWEAGGAMWVEADCNVPSGESLVRQILHGTRYWERAFGEQGRQNYLYLPDTFGFNAALPQIMALAGLRTFITNKMSWNDADEFPHTTFCWRGLDGTEVLAHCTPGRDYNATLTPPELQRGEKEIARKGGRAGAVWLQPFGYGDGGGGPNAANIECALLARQCEGLPAVTMARAETFCAELQRERGALRAGGQDLPVWDGELYLEYHRGTYTTQAWLKRANRKAEQALRAAEWLSVGPLPTVAGAVAPVSDRRAVRPVSDRSKELDKAWKLLLLNQFHDILPGSSITEVYDDTRQQHAEIRAICDEAVSEGTARWVRAADTAQLSRPMAVFNPSSTDRSGVVDCDGALEYVANVPALGMAVRDRDQATSVVPASVSGQTLSNGIMTATIDDVGRIASLRRIGSEREAGARAADGSVAPLNQLVLYDDRPRFWDAWDIDIDHVEKAMPVRSPAESWRVVESGPLRAVIEVVRPLGQASRMTQRFVLAAGAPRVDIHTHVDWHEGKRLLRALFPLEVRARRATYEIAFGHLERPTHRNTPWDRAMFEVCAHRWMDLSEPGFGVALLNDCKYGHSCHDSVMGLSLLRSSKFPDPLADMGVHEFTYSLMPHAGDWRAAGVDREAEALNAPLWAVPVAAGQRGTLPREWTPFTIGTEGAARVEVVAVKRAEESDQLILRLVETHGGGGRASVTWHIPVPEVAAVDLLERPMELRGLIHDAPARQTRLEIRPFQIVTLAAFVPSSTRT